MTADYLDGVNSHKQQTDIDLQTANSKVASLRKDLDKTLPKDLRAEREHDERDSLIVRVDNLQSKVQKLNKDLSESQLKAFSAHTRPDAEIECKNLQSQMELERQSNAAETEYLRKLSSGTANATDFDNFSKKMQTIWKQKFANQDNKYHDLKKLFDETNNDLMKAQLNSSSEKMKIERG